jgi:predicted cation transporter
MGLVMTGVTMSALFFENSLSRIISRATVYVYILGKLAMLGAGFYLMWYWLVGDGRVILELRLDQLIS